MTGASRLPEGSFIAGADVQRVLALLGEDGEQAFVVGGAVRNTLLGRPLGDVDIATTALPRDVMRRAKAAGMRAVPTGIEHGTVTLLVDHHPFEVTTLRRDVETDGRRAVVSFSRNIEDDAARRDFTMNALYATADGTVLDPVGGLPDLAARRVRFIGDAERRIREDYLRILRLFRFHADYGEGALDPEGRDAAVRLRAGLGRLSAERVRAEWLKLLAARRGPLILGEVSDLGFAERVLGSPARPGVLSRLVDALPGADPALRLAASGLFCRGDGERLAERLRLSRAEARLLDIVGLWLDRLHGRVAGLDRAAVRRMSHGLGPEARPVLGIAAAADGLDVGTVLSLHAATLDAPAPVSPFTGAGLLARGLTPGPAVGRILAAAESAWADEDFPSDPARCEAILAAAIEADGVQTREGAASPAP